MTERVKVYYSPRVRILAHRIVNGKTEYLVQWEECSYLQSTYEPECNLSYAQ
eukprot:COSAG02_NODE_52572_length_307_cov_0.625000_1_plen_51_part_10